MHVDNVTSHPVRQEHALAFWMLSGSRVVRGNVVTVDSLARYIVVG